MNKMLSEDFSVEKVEMVFVFDCRSLLEAFTMLAAGKIVETYYSPRHFLDNVTAYPKHTKMFFGQIFNNFDMSGLQIADHLHSLGFTQLYLLTSQDFSDWPIPKYLTVISKHDTDEISRVVGGK